MLDFFTLIVKRHSNKTTYTSVSMSLRFTTISSSLLFDYTSRDYLLAVNHQIDGTRIDLAPLLIMLTQTSTLYNQRQWQCVQNAIILQSCQTHVFRLWGVNFTFVNVVNCHEKCELGLKKTGWWRICLFLLSPKNTSLTLILVLTFNCHTNATDCTFE